MGLSLAAFLAGTNPKPTPNFKKLPIPNQIQPNNKIKYNNPKQQYNNN